MAKETTVQIAERLADPILTEMGLQLWDVRFEKEGPNWYLRYYIDKQEGLSITDCENFSRAVEKKLDEEDPIEQSYILEVSSPGLERKLTRDRHYEALMGEKISLKLHRPDDDGRREYTGILTGFDGETITLTLDDGTTKQVVKKDTASVWKTFEE